LKLFEISKDGGPESTVWAHWLVEIKWLFSIVLLRFENGSRDAYHNHAFNCISWVLKGKLVEHVKEIAPAGIALGQHYPAHDYHFINTYTPSLKPVMTYRDTMHKVVSEGRTWVVSFRGPWGRTWKEIENGEGKTLTNGRRVVY
jgi:hypothetical protein